VTDPVHLNRNQVVPSTAEPQVAPSSDASPSQPDVRAAKRRLPLAAWIGIASILVIATITYLFIQNLRDSRAELHALAKVGCTRVVLWNPYTGEGRNPSPPQDYILPWEVLDLLEFQGLRAADAPVVESFLNSAPDNVCLDFSAGDCVVTGTDVRRGVQFVRLYNMTLADEPIRPGRSVRHLVVYRSEIPAKWLRSPQFVHRTEYVALGESRLTPAALDSLSGWTSLTCMRISHCELPDATALARLTQLTTLNVSASGAESELKAATAGLATTVTIEE
jgi:hypothetical protein